MTRLLRLVAAAALVSACEGEPPAEGKPPDAGPPAVAERDGSVTMPPVRRDAGPPLSPSFPLTACPEDATEGLQVESGALVGGLCLALRHLEYAPTVNGAPPASASLTIGGAYPQSFGGPVERGLFPVNVLRQSYERLSYQPSDVHPGHSGSEIFFADELNQLQDAGAEPRGVALPVRAYTLSGSVTVNGAPPKRGGSGADVVFSVLSSSGPQTAPDFSREGGYQVRFLAGLFRPVQLSMPSWAAHGTSLSGYLALSLLDFTRDSVLDVDIGMHPVEGRILLDGRPIPDLVQGGPDFELRFSSNAVVATTVHEGGHTAEFSALVPHGVHDVELSFPGGGLQGPYPGDVVGLALARGLQVDGVNDARLEAALTTHQVEGALLIDGQPIRPEPGTWPFLWYGSPPGGGSFFRAVYDVPRNRAAFDLRAFPGRYSDLLVVLDESMADDFVGGNWFPRQGLVVPGDGGVGGISDLLFNISTRTVEGNLRIDGQAPPVGTLVGTLSFRPLAVGSTPAPPFFGLGKRVRCGPQGSFRVRLPVGKYAVSFAIDRSAYPEYASGNHVVVSELDLTKEDRRGLQLDYETALITGPLRVDGQVLDTAGGDKVGLALSTSNARFSWGAVGGPFFRLRIPRAVEPYRLVVNLASGALPRTASGAAPLGATLHLEGQPLRPSALQPR